MPHSKGAWLAGFAALTTGGLFGFTSSEPTRLTFLAVGQGDCAVFQHQDATILFDAGPRTEFMDAGERIVVPRLRALGVDRVDLVLISHPDEDHLGGLGAVLKEHPSARLALSNQFRHSSAVRARFREFKVSPSSVVWLDEEHTARIGKFTLQIYNPPMVSETEDNAGSMFVRLSNGYASAVLTGDAPQEVETQCAAEGDWSAQILKAGHHGSRSSTSAAWIEEVKPISAVISCGRDNVYGHPAREVLARLSGREVLRTDKDGDVSFECDDTSPFRRYR